MGHKRRPTAHQKQIRFLTILIGVIMMIAVIAMLILFNRPPGGAH